jgi:hypothetical protein
MGLFSGGNAGNLLSILGATLKDVNNGGETNNVGALNALMEERADKLRKQKAMADFAAAIPGLLGGNAALAVGGPAMQGPGVDGAPVAPPATGQATQPPASMPDIARRFLPYMVNPETAPMASSMVGMMKLMEPEKPSYIEGPDGIYAIDRSGASKRVQAYPEKAPAVSPGWTALPDGSWAPVKNGPYDPDYIAKTSGLRRDAIVQRPMPRVGGGGRGGGGASAPPWKRKW